MSQHGGDPYHLNQLTKFSLELELISENSLELVPISENMSFLKLL